MGLFISIRKLSKGSLVSPVLFIIYLSGLFRTAEDRVEKFLAKLFADDFGSLVEDMSLSELQENMGKTCRTALVWKEDIYL